MDEKLKQLSFADLAVLKQMLEQELKSLGSEPGFNSREQSIINRNLFAVTHIIVKKKKKYSVNPQTKFFLP